MVVCLLLSFFFFPWNCPSSLLSKIFYHPFKGNAVIYGMKEWQHYIKEKLEDNTVVMRKPTDDGQFHGKKKKDKNISLHFL
jgi:hypothetical protein